MSHLQFHQPAFELNAGPVGWRSLAIGLDLLDQGALVDIGHDFRGSSEKDQGNS